MLELPEFSLLKRQPRAPNVARTVAKRDVPNEYGTPITYAVEQGRNGRDWWIHASLNGHRMSNTLHTSMAAKGAAWIRAVETGQICVECVTKKSDAQIAREVDESLARLTEKIKQRGWCVAKYLEVLSHELVRYDVSTSAKEAKRGHVNIYRLGHLMGALGRVRDEVGSRTTDSAADQANFRMAMYANFERDFPPVKKVVKQLEAGTCKIK